MIRILTIFFDHLWHSFTNSVKGFSARKLTAFAITVVVIYAHIKWLASCYNNNHFDLLPQVLIIDFSAILSLLGLTTWERVKSLGNIINNNNNNNSSGGGGNPIVGLNITENNNVTNRTKTTNTPKRRRKRNN